MRSDELAEKLGKQFALFGQGKDKKIKHKDLDKIIAKLAALRDGLTELATATKASKKAERIAKHRDDAARLLDRATWLQGQIAPLDTEEVVAENVETVASAEQGPVEPVEAPAQD
jgi:hypothetical protein